MIITTKRVSWKENKFICEFHADKDFSKISPITQVQALCRSKDGKYVIYKDREGNYGLPGGSPEAGESLEEALKRELLEEVAAVLLKAKPLLYLKFTHLPKSKGIITYQVRYLALVDPQEQEIQDPDGVSIERLLVNETEMTKLLNWGDSLQIYLDEAKKINL